MHRWHNSENIPKELARIYGAFSRFYDGLMTYFRTISIRDLPSFLDKQSYEKKATNLEAVEQLKIRADLLTTHCSQSLLKMLQIHSTVPHLRASGRHSAC